MSEFGTQQQESTDAQHRIRQQLVSLSLRPREAEARASIAQSHLGDYSDGEGLA